MTDMSNNVGEKPTEEFNALSFERKLVELVEELRLKRNLEVESEKTLKSVMDEKYQEELSWDEQMKKHSREKNDLALQVEHLKRKLEDKVCVSDEDKSEKLNLQKKIQELEGKLKLHDNFQDTISNQISEVRKMMKANFEESKELMGLQQKVLENVASAKFMLKKFELSNQHLHQCLKIIEKKSEILKKELIASRCEITLLKQSVSTTKEKTCNYLEVEKLQKKVLDLENLLLSSRKENENTLSNFLESNKLLCKFVDKFSEIEKREKELTTELESSQDKLRVSQNELQKTKDEMKDMEEKAALKEKEKIENHCSTAMQTENTSNQSCSCSETLLKPSDKVTTTLTSFIPEAMDNSFMDEFRNGLVNLQQNALMMQSEMSVSNGIQSFSLDQLCVNAADKRITLSQVLKRKLEIVESGDPIEMIMKKRFMGNASQSVIAVHNEVEKGLKNDMVISCDPSGVPLCGKFNQDATYLSSSVKPKMLLSHETNVQPLCNNLSSDVSLLLPSNDIQLDQKYLTYKKFPEKINENEENDNKF